jgi:hypothetical protein
MVLMVATVGGQEPTPGSGKRDNIPRDVVVAIGGRSSLV